MARYYDLDKLKEMVEAKADTLIEGKEAFLHVAKWLDLLPPADVAPRSTINEIFALIWDAFQSTYYDSEFEEKFDKIEKKYMEKGCE